MNQQQLETVQKKVHNSLIKLKASMGALALSAELGSSSTETLNRWLRHGVPKTKALSIQEKVKVIKAARRNLQ